MAFSKPLYLLAALAFVGGTLIAADDPFAGTWKLDLERSTYTNHEKPKELTLTITDQGENRVLTFNGTAADGSPIKMEIAEPLRGGPVTGALASNSWDSITLKVISPTSHEMVYSKNGKEVATRHIKMSGDHQTFTARFTGPNTQGKQITQDDFWRKQ